MSRKFTYFGSSWANTKSLLLGGTDEYLNTDSVLAAVKSSSIGAISFWFKIADAEPTGNPNIFCFGDTDANSMIRCIFLGTGFLRFECVIAGTGQWRKDTSVKAFQNNIWHHVTFVQNGFGGVIYIDGILPTQAFSLNTSVSKWFANIAGLDNGRFGCKNANSAGNTNFITNANYKDLLIISGVTAQSVVVNIYNNGQPKNEIARSGAVAYYRTGDNAGDNYNVDNANEWTFIDEIGTNDIFTSTTIEQADVVSDAPNNLIATNSKFNNSINYSAGLRSTDSEFEFNYSGTYLRVEADVTGTDDRIAIFIDGVYSTQLKMVDDTPQVVTLGAGAKVVKLVEARVRTTGLLGTRLKSVVLQTSAFSKLNDGNVAERFVFLGDSITQGNEPTNHFTSAYAQLFKYTDSKNVTILGYGGAWVKQLAETSPLIATTVGWITDAFSDTTTTKKLIIALGINDFLNGESAANIGTWYANLLDAIILADPTIEIFGITPLTCSTENATLVAIRAAIATAYTTRGLTVINGTSICTYAGDYADTVHPNTGGHLKIHNAIDGIIL